MTQTTTQAVLLSAVLCCGTMNASDIPAVLSEHLGATPALIVLVCDGNSEDLPAVKALVEQTPWTILCRAPAGSGADQIRAWARDSDQLSDRVYVLDAEGDSLWLAGDMADAVWVRQDVAVPPSETEILRVLHPGGIGIASGKASVKGVPPGVDEWRHPYHGPDNNVVSEDSVARLPGELRFQAHPVFAPMPNQTLFAGGRIFFFAGHIAFHEREEPLLNTLTVLNAYNGLKIWSRPLDEHCVVHNLSKVATEREVVFAEGKILWRLDAATGHELGQMRVPPAAAVAGCTDWKWIAQEKDMLWAAFGPPDGRVAALRRKQEMGHWPWNVANDQYRNVTENFGTARRLAAYQYPEMKLLWMIQEPEPFDARALCIESNRIFELGPRSFMAVREARTGQLLWCRKPEVSAELFEAIGSALKRQGWGLGWATYCTARARNGVVCIAGPPFKKTIGVGLEKGQLLWSFNTESPHPFFLKDSLYIMPRVGGPSVTCRTIEPLTGQVLDQFDLGVIGSCTRLTATPTQFYFRPGGGEGRTVYVDVNARKLADYEGVVRPGCFDGVVPANGRLYWMPLACDCWQVHGTFSMAPRQALKPTQPPISSTPWATPSSGKPAAQDDWPMFRANAAGTASVPIPIPNAATEWWRRRPAGGELTPPVCVQDRVFVGGTDGTVRAMNTRDGTVLWQRSAQAAVLYPPAYWKGRVVFGSCDGLLYCLDAANGRILGRAPLAPEPRFVNIMNRFMSAWPLSGGVVLDQQGLAYTAAGSTAADGTIVAAVEVATGTIQWRQAYTLDRSDPKLSFGVQGNILLKEDTLYINGGAPVGMVALDARTGDNPRVIARLEAGMDMFLEPEDKLASTGPELFSNQRARTTIFKRHQGRVYFQVADCQVALVDGRLFGARDRQALDRIVDLMNKDPLTGGRMGGLTVPRDVMKVPIDNTILWASPTADIRGLALGTNGLVVLHKKSVEGLSASGQSLWTVPLPATPVRWGIALTAKHSVVTLSDGHVLCLGKDGAVH